ncbi:MAG TPA: hypothetical protein VMV02_01740 [Acidimicrobiales bacterium]|nr:hypothetical protein [Acidimicrobiales bacterium]
MENEPTTGGAVRPPGWYVSRVISIPAEKVRALAPLGGVVAPDGVSLRIGGLVERALPLEDHVSYDATLVLSGRRPRRVKVELVVTRYSGNLAEVGIRPAARVPQRRVAVEQYFDAVWSVLDALARADHEAPQAPPAGALHNAARRLARAS